MVRTLFGQVKQYRKETLLTPLFTAGEVVMEVLLPFIMAFIIDRGIESGDFSKIILYGVVMLACAFFSLFCGRQAGRYAAIASAGFAANLREGMYANIQTFSFSNIDKYSTAGLVTRMTTDVTNVQNAYMMVLRVAVRSPLMFVCALVACLITNARLSMIFVVATVFLVIVLAAIIARSLPIFNEVFRRYDDLNASVEENVGGIRVVKAFVREAFEHDKFKAAADRLYRLYVRAEGLLAFNSPVMMLVVYFCIIGISWFGARFVVAGSLTTGELTSMFSYIMMILMSLMMLSMVFVMVAMALASARRIVEVLEEKSDLTSPVGALTEIADGEVRFNHVDFAYASGTGENVLSDVNLTIRSGETVGIVGGTGAGKSSLVSLISRLYDVSSGSVSVGGRDVRSYDLETLHNGVAVVLQNNVLFSGTVLDNLRWGKADATREECEAACRAACADEFIDRLPDGYDTMIEQGGTNVSGGQRQRLCIARTLLKQPQVLILDDSTSAVDTATEAKIRAGFAEAIPGTTKLIIAQRISSVENADRVIVLEDGRVTGFDTPERLFETNATYKDMYETQKNGGDFDE